MATVLTAPSPPSRRGGIIALVLVIVCGAGVLAAVYLIGRRDATEPAPHVPDSVAGSAPARQSPAGPRRTPTAFVGTWRVHGGTLEIRSDLTGESVWNAGPCGNSMCVGRERIAFTVAGDQLVGRTEAATVEDEDGNPGPPELLGDSGADGAGATMTLSPVDDGVLQRTYDPPLPGNPYLCGDAASDAWRTECNI